MARPNIGPQLKLSCPQEVHDQLDALAERLTRVMGQEVTKNDAARLWLGMLPSPDNVAAQLVLRLGSSARLSAYLPW